MTDLLFVIYPWIKSLHVISVISWMAGLFYLPRLFVHHVESVARNSDSEAVFQMMERKLLRVIMTPAMIATWLFGLILVVTPGIIDWTAYWPWTKAVAVIAMTWFHMWCAGQRKAIETGRNTRPGSYFRKMNEVPTLLMFIIVFSVIARPF
ncbi:CopD family protein [Oceaniovalibus sp. ACAM 378]|uniref:CopD family protein n=1 Tax=Oceaniovalibus sp. ACAM 378 TaxID=2599923 RepID=UPI0011D7658F|nr:CopD family protein [Oceaniovalibus sp. ACAM 378]TYB86432.1 CopD family protein [Oceaniovalibus sp. ACAM 378]